MLVCHMLLVLMDIAREVFLECQQVISVNKMYQRVLCSRQYSPSSELRTKEVSCQVLELYLKKYRSEQEKTKSRN